MEYSSDVEMLKIKGMAEEFYGKVLYDEEPFFVSDEATIWDVSTASEAELLLRCAGSYGKAISADDLRKPLWQLIRNLNGV
jgi:hypothetical protein